MTTDPALSEAPFRLREDGEGRAEIVLDGTVPAAGGAGGESLHPLLGRLLGRAFEELGLRTVRWHVPVGEWELRRLGWQLGFTVDGTVRAWVPDGDGGLRDAWVATLRSGDPREPRTTWLDNPVVEGDGVRLRPFTDADAPRIVEGLGDAEVQHWLSFMPRDPGEQEAREYLEKVTERLATAHTVTWAFCTPDDDRLLGVVGLYRLQEEAELGYWTHPEGRGRGLTTRAARLAVAHGFDVLGLDRLAGYAAVPNTASRRVLEACGFRPVGVQRHAAHTGDGRPVDLAAYDLLPHETTREQAPDQAPERNRMTSAPPTLTDGNVTIRGHREDDAQGSFEQCQDPLSQEWTTVPVPYSMEDARTFVTEIMPKGWVDDSEWGFAVEVDGRYAGTISLRNEGSGRAEIAYGSHPWVRGTGAMERALRLLLEWGFAERGLQTVVWQANKGNWASRKVAWRLGFSFEGTLRRWLPHRGELRDAWVGTLLRDDPREPQGTWLAVPVLEADGLRLRAFTEADVPRIVEACSDPETQRWVGDMPSPYDEGSARWWLDTQVERRARGEELVWAVVDPADDLVLASISVFDWTPRVELEIGYWAHPGARGRGITTRAVAVVLRHAFEELGVNRVKIFAAADNAPSRKVIEHNGFRYTGVERLGTRVRDGYADIALYDMLAEEWAERAAERR